jgi:hypothetical protein
MTELEILFCTDESGDYIDVLELRMAEPIYDRVKRLKLLLSSDDYSARLDSAILLTSWGIEDGVDYLEDFLDRDATKEEGKYLCRNNRDDCTYDIIGESLVLFTEKSLEIPNKAIAPLRKILHLFGEKCFADSGTVSFLKHADISTHLVKDFEKVIKSCLESGNAFEASEFLPLYAKWGGEKIADNAIEYARSIINHSDSSVSKVHVATTLFHLPLTAAITILPLLETSNDSGVKFYVDKFRRLVKRSSS